MKNLTPSVIVLIRQDGSRAYLPASATCPTIEEVPAEALGRLGELEIIRQSYKRVHFHGLTDDREKLPFIVSREVFDALPDDATDFVMCDVETAIVNGLGLPHVIRRFIAKPAAQIPFKAV
jgi:hypothetical protein